MKIAAEEQRRKGAEENQTTSRLSAALPHRSKSNALTIAGIPVSNLSEQNAVEVIEALISEGGSHYGAVVNAAKLVAASRDDALRSALLNADLVTADGMSVVWASRVLGRALKERVAGIDLFERLVERAASKGLAVYFLGAREEAVRGTVELFGKKYPALRVAGYRNGYFEAADSRQVCEAIKQANADLLFVAMGSPRQENWIASNLALTGVRFALGVGGSFDHLGGRARRAPRWMQRSGLEWLHRLAQEPRRLWRRYLFGNSAFIWLVMRERLRGRGPAPQK
jgi:N-acetylglucosaminyldiphosphoundecaprenol N-acetyl-beta-D-mannosaminyltransferase